MRRELSVLAVALAALLASSARADLIVTLSPKGADLNPVSGPVPAGTALLVEILLSVDGNDNPLADLRLLQFDFAATDSTLTLGTFAWELDANAYGFVVSTLPAPSAVSLFTGSDSRLLSLNDNPLRVATVAVTVDGDGILNAVGSLDVGQGSQAAFNAGFEPPMPAFSLPVGNLRGGTVELTVAVPTPSDIDGDGVPNTGDAFPEDPTESVDTDGNGIGNNADSDDDGDAVEDPEDAFPLDPAETADTDDDGVGDNTDTFPDDPAETVDTDDNGVGDNADPDDDGDGFDDGEDAFPQDPTESTDSDGDGIGDHANGDSDAGPQTRPSICGAAMLGTLLTTLCGLGMLRLCRRR
jgi:hypothetical protein